MGRKKEFSNTWWADKWINLLESFGWASRLQRGRTYARNDRVQSIDIKLGVVKAKVKGTRVRPYDITIRIQPLSKQEWNKVIDIMASQAIFAARLLVGEMPLDIEEAFLACKVSLFPESSRDIETDCSCPDWANPCKHIAAVHYILAQEFDEDPFLIFRLRGMERDDIIQALRERRSIAKEDEETSQVDLPKVEEQTDIPLSTSIDSFWKAQKGLESFTLDISKPEVTGAILKRLGPPPFAPEDEELLARLKEAYSIISKKAVETAYGLTD